MRIDAILFDFDGVLVDSEPVHHACWAEVVRRHGLDLSWEDYVARCIGVSDRAMIAALCDLAGRPELFETLWAEYPNKKARFRERMSEAVPMPEATVKLLADLSSSYRLAVVSSSGRSEVVPALESIGVDGCFSAIVSGEDVGKLKPDPEPYRLAASLLGALHPLVVEDSEAGVASGRAAGFEVIQVRHAAETAERVLRRVLGEAAS